MVTFYLWQMTTSCFFFPSTCSNGNKIFFKNKGIWVLEANWCQEKYFVNNSTPVTQNSRDPSGDEWGKEHCNRAVLQAIDSCHMPSPQQLFRVRNSSPQWPSRCFLPTTGLFSVERESPWVPPSPVSYSHFLREDGGSKKEGDFLRL